MIRSLRILASTAALAIALPVAARAQDQPVTPKQVAKNVQSETHRVGNRTRDEAHKVGKQTNAQAKRTGKSLARLVSRKARKGDYSHFDADGTPATTSGPTGPSLKTSKPLTPKQVGLTVSGDVKRAGKQTENQLHRTGKSLEKLVSRKARHDSTE
jgi:hypothetical protein